MDMGLRETGNEVAFADAGGLGNIAEAAGVSRFPAGARQKGVLFTFNSMQPDLDGKGSDYSRRIPGIGQNIHGGIRATARDCRHDADKSGTPSTAVVSIPDVFRRN